VALKPEASITVGLATAGVVYGIFAQATPSIADIRVASPNDEHIATSERTATWQAAVVVSGISLIARDPTIFILGGAMVVAMAWWTRHANAVNPLTGSASLNNVQVVEALQGDDDNMAEAAGF
jgi:hypothetical protein